jgi:hypothetical protein
MGYLPIISVSVSPNAKTTDFSSTIPDYKMVLRAPFREWAENTLVGERWHSIQFGPAKIDCSVHSPPLKGAGNQKYAIRLQEDGLPLLPILDINLVSPNDARLMSRAYIELTWNESLKLNRVVLHLL